MKTFWRQMYQRFFMAAGLLALLFVTAGFAPGEIRFEELLKPKQAVPAPVAQACEEKVQLAPLKWMKPSWCQSAVISQAVDSEKPPLQRY